MILLWDLKKVPMEFHDGSMIFPCKSYGIPMAFPLDFHDVSMMIFPWDYYAGTEGILWDSKRFSLWFLCNFHVISIIFLLDFCGIPIGFP